MNRNKLKTYAPKARRDFIRAVTEQAAKVGIGRAHIEPVEVQGDVAIIGGRAFPRNVAEQRRKLESRIGLHGFDQVMEGVAYTWFNRFAAIRYMEVHEYFDHGYRVLSHPEGKDLPEILGQADHVDLPGLDRERVIDLKLDGTKDAELYRMLLIAQCNALHAAMPFLFEKIDDETELLLPNNLLHSDSLIRQMVAEIDEEDWREIEIIGWLYQFYISEKKDQVIGKVVKSEDIPAATQLFTPNWIVKYMVQNSLGHQWLATYPDSPLRSEMDYYIEPAEQGEEVQRQLAEITPTELNPEELTLLDPACGSGHILVEAYDLFKQIYLERGYRLKDIPRLILEKNLYGLDIDDRAAQLAGFALLMKARADDRRILSSDNPPRLSVMAIQNGKGLDAEEITRALLPEGQVDLVPSHDLLPETLSQPSLAMAPRYDVTTGTIRALIDLFEDGKTFGSLITVPEQIATSLPALKQLLAQEKSGDLLKSSARGHAVAALMPLLRQARSLARCYDAVVANPPYMGRKYYCPALEKYVDENYPASAPDMYACFAEAGLNFLRPFGILANINIPGWMSNSTFSDFRQQIVLKNAILSLIHNGRGVFGSDFGSCAFSLLKSGPTEFVGTYKRLFENLSTVLSNLQLADGFHECPEFETPTSGFFSIAGAPISYWVSESVREAYGRLEPMQLHAKGCQGISTSDDKLFVRAWHEVSINNSSLKESEGTLGRNSATWFPYNKGGEFRKWYGNISYFLNWKNEGSAIKARKPKSVIRNESQYLKSCVSWQDYTISKYSFRFYPDGFIFATNAHSAFIEDQKLIPGLLSLCNSNALLHIAAAISPDLHFNSGYFNAVPFSPVASSVVAKEIGIQAIALAKSDWDAYETSWDFTHLPLLHPDHHKPSLARTYVTVRAHWQSMTGEMQRLEAENNRLFIDAYGLDDELTPEVPLSETTLTCNPNYRYGGDLSNDEREGRLRADTMRELISYAIGCMMGRYSLDEPGLIYAHGGNESFDPSRCATFSPDQDGIIPITDMDWFDDDAARRISEFLVVAWSSETLAENLRFVADSLSMKQSETPLAAIRRYLSSGFYKDHLKTYKKRPIYWLFSSGKRMAFECLSYLHRYNESTLSRMRMEYVIPLQSKFAARIEQLVGDITAATSTANRRKLEKERDSLLKKQTELVEFDDKLRHYADQRIALDLDDGVKVNYGKFGDLLAEAKTVTGKKDR